MSTTIEATYDGSVFRPTQPVFLTPNTTVRLTVETLATTAGPPTSFLQTARALNLQGPPDWASNLDEYLYGEETGGGE
ncbi:MAG TPA: antitoxin family protein [Lacipirellulaceae bacterium]